VGKYPTSHYELFMCRKHMRPFVLDISMNGAWAACGVGCKASLEESGWDIDCLELLYDAALVLMDDAGVEDGEDDV
jgi:hypothetical protein